MKFLKDLSRRQKRTVIRLLISLVLLIAASLIPLDGIWKFLIFLPAYIVIGCLVKYGIILMASGFFISYLGSEEAQTVTLVFVFAVIIISFIASYFKKRKEGLET